MEAFCDESSFNPSILKRKIREREKTVDKPGTCVSRRSIKELCTGAGRPGHICDGQEESYGVSGDRTLTVGPWDSCMTPLSPFLPGYIENNKICTSRELKEPSVPSEPWAWHWWLPSPCLLSPCTWLWGFYDLNWLGYEIPEHLFKHDCGCWWGCLWMRLTF